MAISSTQSPPSIHSSGTLGYNSVQQARPRSSRRLLRDASNRYVDAACADTAAAATIVATTGTKMKAPVIHIVCQAIGVGVSTVFGSFWSIVSHVLRVESDNAESDSNNKALIVAPQDPDMCSSHLLV